MRIMITLRDGGSSRRAPTSLGGRNLSHPTCGSDGGQSTRYNWLRGVRSAKRASSKGLSTRLIQFISTAKTLHSPGAATECTPTSSRLFILSRTITYRAMSIAKVMSVRRAARKDRSVAMRISVTCEDKKQMSARKVTPAADNVWA